MSKIKQISYYSRNTRINRAIERVLNSQNAGFEIDKITIERTSQKWHRILFGGRPNDSLLMADLIVSGNLYNYAKKIYKFNYQINYYRHFDRNRWISEKDKAALNELLYKQIKADPEFIYKLAEKIEEIGFKIIDLANKYKKVNWERKSDKELTYVFEKFSDLEFQLYGGGFWFYGWNLFFKNIYLNKFLADLERKSDKNEFKEILDNILAPNKTLSKNCFNCQERLAFYNLARKFAKFKGLPPQYIKKHLDKFAFLGKDYFRGEGLSYNQIYDELKQVAEKGEKYIDKNLKIYRIKNLDIDKFDLPPGYKLIIKGFEKMNTATSLADEATNFFTYHLKSLLNEISKRLEINYEDLISMRAQEIKDSLETGRAAVSLEQLRNRSKNYALIFAKNKVYVLNGKNLEEYKKNELKNEIKNDIYEFKGMVASKSKRPIKGKVVLVKSKEKLKSLKKNSILVTEMTYPDNFFPTMKKSKAIITDEGGILCHAAILSREFHIPCIIGTKIATKILKTGDLVEINTDNGLIKILKKAK